MRIAICDDQQESLDLLELMLQRISRTEYIKKYSCTRQIMMDMEGGEEFDTIIMDIDWNQERNGIDFASEISFHYPHTKIIYLTGYNEEYSQKIFLKASNLSGYVTKPVNFEILKANIEKVWSEKQTEINQKLLITCQNRPLTLWNKDIYYLESKGHKVVIHTKGQEYVCYEKLSEIHKRLENYFLSCHKSFLVNMEVISCLEHDKFILNDGCEVSISKKKYDEVRRIYFRYLGDTLLKNFSAEEDDNKQ